METSKEQEIIQHLININLALQNPHNKFEEYVSQLSSKALGLSSYIQSVSDNFRDLIGRLGSLIQETHIIDSLSSINMGSERIIQIEKNIYHLLATHENRTKESLKELDIVQTLSEIKYIGNRLKSIEERLTQIEKSGIKSDVIVTVLQNEKPIEITNKKDAMGELLNRLDPRLRTVIVMRYGLSDGVPKKYGDIGKYLGISAVRVSQIEKKTLRMLRKITLKSKIDSSNFEDGKLKEQIFGKGK